MTSSNERVAGVQKMRVAMPAKDFRFSRCF